MNLSSQSKAILKISSSNFICYKFKRSKVYIWGSTLVNSSKGQPLWHLSLKNRHILLWVSAVEHLNLKPLPWGGCMAWLAINHTHTDTRPWVYLALYERTPAWMPIAVAIDPQIFKSLLLWPHLSKEAKKIPSFSSSIFLVGLGLKKPSAGPIPVFKLLTWCSQDFQELKCGIQILNRAKIVCILM